MIKERKELWTSKNGPRTTTKYIVMHHAAATYVPGKAVQAIYDYHRKKWRDYFAAGYHVICQEEVDGSIQCYLVNPPDMQGAGVAFRNHETFHICLATNFKNDVPEKRWIVAAQEAYRYAKERYPDAELVGHRDIALPASPTTCPGGAWEQWKAEVSSVTSQGTVSPAIMGGPTQNIDLLRHVLTLRKAPESVIVPVIAAYTAYGELTGIGNVYPLAQGIVETGWFTSPRFLQANNPAGLGAISSSVWGNTFPSISAGIFAQYAHLLTYASKPNEYGKFLEQIAQLSPRYNAVVQAYGRGSARTWMDLSGKWAADTDYGKKILAAAQIILRA